jgi:hypothetical protein
MTISLTKAGAKALAVLAHEYLAEGGQLPGVDTDDVADALRALELATFSAPLQVGSVRNPPTVNTSSKASSLLEDVLRDVIEQLDAIGIPDWSGAEGLCLECARAVLAEPTNK